MPAKRSSKVRDKKFRLLFEDNPQPMWVFDLETQDFLEVNEAAASLHGYTSGEFHGMKLAAFLGEHNAARFAAELSLPGVPAARMWRHRTKSGRLIDIESAVY